MTKWDYFNIGAQTCAISAMIYALVFGEVTLWPMKWPLWRHAVLYPVVLVVLIIAFVMTLRQMWG